MYESIEFERIGLFECLKSEFGERNILYLGSSVHVTPSFVFSNVTYVDNSENTRDFFKDETAVRQFVKRKKVYRHEPKIKYVNADYNTGELSKQHDLILALFAPGSLGAASRAASRNALIVYLPLPSENRASEITKDLKITGSVQMKNGKYQYSKNHHDCSRPGKDMIANKFNDIYSYTVLKRR